MPIILTILGLLTAGAVWYWRIQAAKDATETLVEAASDVRLAARRFGFRRRLNNHPVDSVDDARLAAAGVVIAIASMDSELTQAEIDALSLQCQSKFSIDRAEADAIVVLGRWLANQCGTFDEAARRLTKRVNALAGVEAAPDLLEMIDKVARKDGKPLDERAADAVGQVKRGFFLH